MFNSATCRAARALLGWSQQELALKARVSTGMVKSFESETRMPIANNLAAMRNAFEAAGVNFLIGEDGALGVLIGGVRWGAYIPGTGIYFYVPLTDLDMEPTDETELWFLLEDLAILELAGRFPRDDLDAKQIGRDNRERILGAIRGRALRYYEEGPAKPRRITAEDLNNAAMLG